LHEQIGERLEIGFSGRTVESSTELARHFEGGHDRRRALVYLEQAAMRAYDRRAFRDVTACLERALGLLGNLPDSVERARDELRLRRLLAVVLSQTAGYAADVVLKNLKQTQRLADRLGDVATLFDVRCALILMPAASDISRKRRNFWKSWRSSPTAWARLRS
jgi:hypothetical protein